MQTRFETIIIGGGYAGLIAAARVARKRRGTPCGDESIVLISPNTHFRERIRWHENLGSSPTFPTRKLSLQNFLLPLGVDVVEASVTAIDRSNRTVDTDHEIARQIVYSKLIVACGSSSSQPGIPGLEKYAYRMDMDGGLDITGLRQRLQQPVEPSEERRVVVIGSGATGIEVAGEIAGTPATHVTIISSGNFAPFTVPPVASSLRAFCDAQSVKIIEHAKVRKISSDGVVCNDRELISDITIWCGGLAVPAFVGESGLNVDEQGRVLVDDFLRSSNDKNVFAAGDACLPLHNTGAPPRMSAFFALSSGAYVADRIVDGCPDASRAFRFATYGQGIQFGTGGIGFTTFPFDIPKRPFLYGSIAFRLRKFFVGLLFHLIILQANFGPLPFVIRPPLWLIRRRTAAVNSS